jgi:hypothetical protein
LKNTGGPPATGFALKVLHCVWPTTTTGGAAAEYALHTPVPAGGFAVTVHWAAAIGGPAEVITEQVSVVIGGGAPKPLVRTEHIVPLVPSVLQVFAKVPGLPAAFTTEQEFACGAGAGPGSAPVDAEQNVPAVLLGLPASDPALQVPNVSCGALDTKTEHCVEGIVLVLSTCVEQVPAAPALQLLVLITELLPTLQYCGPGPAGGPGFPTLVEQYVPAPTIALVEQKNGPGMGKFPTEHPLLFV